MAGGIIYTKTIDPSVQDGLDNNLIIQPNYAYQNKFEFGDDWNEIIIAFTFSYTFSETYNNLSSDLDTTNDEIANRNSGGTTNDTFSYIGLIKDAQRLYLPEVVNTPLSSDQGFIGNRFYKTVGESTSLNRVFFAETHTNSAGPYTTMIGSNSANTTKEDLSTAEYIYPYDRCWTMSCPTLIGETTDFARTIPFKYKVINKGTSSQSISVEIESVYYRSDIQPRTSDVTLLNLKDRINNFTSVKPDSSTSTFTWNDGSNALPIPDSFFFYNAFLDIRPRIHAIAVKKIS